jgi:hypothetical protein
MKLSEKAIAARRVSSACHMRTPLLFRLRRCATSPAAFAARLRKPGAAACQPTGGEPLRIWSLRAPPHRIVVDISIGIAWSTYWMKTNLRAGLAFVPRTPHCYADNHRRQSLTRRILGVTLLVPCDITEIGFTVSRMPAPVTEWSMVDPGARRAQPRDKRRSARLACR